MKRKIIYLIRHGETALNEQKILQGGGVDSDLNEKGIRQSDNFYAAYQHIPFRKIYTSALKRSIQSVSKFIEAGVPYEPVKEFNELKYGIHDGRSVSEGPQSPYPALITEWNGGNTTARLEGGESPEEVGKRLPIGWNYILSKPEEETILISMHGRAMRILLCVISGLPVKEMQKFPHTNLGLYLIEVVEGKPEIKLWNDTSHFTDHKVIL